MPHIFAAIHDYLIFVCFRKFATSLLDRKKTVFEISLKDMDIKGLVLQLKLMILVMVYVKICARDNAPVYCNKATCVDTLNDAVAGVTQYITCWSPGQGRKGPIKKGPSFHLSISFLRIGSLIISKI